MKKHVSLTIATVIAALGFVLLLPLSDAAAATIEPIVPDNIKAGDVISVPLKVTDAKAQEIEAWGMDIMTDGLEFLGMEKAGTLVANSPSFDSNQITESQIRCGAYHGKIALRDGASLVTMKFKVKGTSAKIRLTGFVDDLAGTKSSAKQINGK